MPKLNIPSVRDCKAYLHKASNYIQNTEGGLAYCILAGCFFLGILGLLFCPKKKK